MTRAGSSKLLVKKPSRFSVFFVVENDVAQILRIVVGRFYACKLNGLIAAQARRFVDRSGINTFEKRIAFWSDDEESARLGESIQSRKIEEPAIHDREVAS